jgi:hypothetical protein
MRKLVIFALVILIISSVGFFCERTVPDRVNLENIQLSNLKGIPLEYGSLISVTNITEYQGWVLLWFESEDKTIRLVGLDYKNNRVGETVTIIPRY